MTQESCEFALDINVETAYMADRSQPDAAQFAFRYTITITNCSVEQLQLISRHWRITDGDGDMHEVSGDGVVGQQPVLLPNKPFTYTSSVMISTEVGSMYGSFYLIDKLGNEVEAEIPAFTLAQPHALH